MKHRLREIFGSHGAWVLPVLAILGVAATFASYGWLGTLIFALVLLFLLVIVFATAALSAPSLPTAAQGGTKPRPLAEEATEAAQGGESPAQSTQDVAGEAEGIADETEEEVKPSFLRGLDAALERDIPAVRSAMDEFIADADDEAEALSRRAIKEFALLRGGDGGALERLRKLADDNPRVSDVQHIFTNALASHGAYRQAVEELAARLDAIQDPEGRAELRLAEAKIRVELGELEAAKHACIELLDSPEAFDAAVQLAEIAETEDDAALSLLYYEHALAIDPTKSSTRFSLAYAASQAGLNELALHHYRILETSGAAGSTALNNIGVVLERGGAIGLSRDYWRRAAEQGSALAAGNLANAAAELGLLEEAQAFAELANEDDESPRVGEALERIARMRREEPETRQSMEKDGKTVSGGLSHLAISEALVLPTGVWVLRGKKFELNSDGDSSEATENGEMCAFDRDEGERLRFRFRSGHYAPTVTGLALPAPDGEGLLLVPVGDRGSKSGVIHARPAPS